MKTAEEFRKAWLQQNPNIVHIPSEHEIGLMESYAKLYHTEKKKKECHCGGYPDCICNITTHDLKDLDQARDDYYNRDRLFERK